ncbi:A-kinase anchor protein 14-like [Suncus etruscus]|uniref:A-kinase anchor protein 14-like n=1 Tax=Suncus etruscus TaxID=109475 RepID=UPI00210F5179|nr:A-kinase anchor protein 14-like [Suncus etruscus]
MDDSGFEMWCRRLTPGCCEQGQYIEPIKKVRFADPLVIDDSIIDLRRKQKEEEAALNAFALNFVKSILNSVILPAKKRPFRTLRALTHGDFTEETGLNHIDALVAIWKHESCWVHYTEFLDKQDVHHSILYNYRVNWSIPTAQIPIPKIETTMDFTIKFSKSKPPRAPVDITYKLDHQTFIQRPETMQFQEKWMREFLLGKYTLLDAVPVTRHAYDLEKIKL